MLIRSTISFATAFFDLSGNFSLEAFEIIVILFVSRNKDNSHLDSFKERKKAFLAYLNGYNIPEWLEEEFNDFVSKGQFTEMCRMYISINARDPDKIKKDLAVELIQDPGGIDLTKADAIVARAAAHDKNKRSDQKRWLFDWDRPIITQTEDQLFNKFCEYVDEYGGGVTVYPTPHGKAVLAEHGFDTRELATNYGETADPKRDALLCRMWEYNYYNTRN